MGAGAREVKRAKTLWGPGPGLGFQNTDIGQDKLS